MTPVEVAGDALPARAKVNLYLHVVGRRADGYHLLDSLVVFPEIGDKVQADRADQLSLHMDGPFALDVPPGPANILTRAAHLLAEDAGISPTAEIRLTKHLPPASGIGGGSADAAAGLRALVTLWGLDLSMERISALALRLGADVPMCLASRTTFVGGVGEVLQPAPPLPPFALLLANPRRELPTAAVFAARGRSFSQPGRFSAVPRDATALAETLRERRNDLTDAAVGICPVIADVLAALAKLDHALLVRMSGSGATCFAMFADMAMAERSVRQLRRDHPDWWLAAAPVAGSPNND